MTNADYMRRLGRKGGLTAVVRQGGDAMAARARQASPQSLEYWRERVRAEQDDITSDADLTARAEASRRLYMGELARRSVAARKKKA